MNPMLNPQLVNFMHISLKACELIGMRATNSLNEGSSGGVASINRTIIGLALKITLSTLEPVSMLGGQFLVARSGHRTPTQFH